MRLQFLCSVTCGVVAAVSLTTAALADSCWDHNGSLMRLRASGNQRWFHYEAPKASLAAAGVRPGTLLFNGVKSGNWYSGTSRVFSKSCPGSPLEYYVEGPVSSDQTRIRMTGTRDANDNCEPTGNMTTDTLVFTYSHDC
jgi:hypothetical protein